MAPHHWMPVGADEFVTMDAKRAYTGDHSPAVQLGRTEARGIQQAGLAVRKGKAYTGRVVLAGPAGTVVKVNLVWGKADGDKQTAVVTIAGTGYKKYPLRFVAQADTDDARIQIVAQGRARCTLGAASLMPADNIQGFRAEGDRGAEAAALGRLPLAGGNFVSGHEWRNAVGDIDQRPPIMDPVWHAVQPNDVGTDEFMTLCRLLDVDAYITVNAGFGDAWSAAQLVEYVNGAATTRWAAGARPMAIRNRTNVKLWGVGNEPWGDWQLGHTSVEQFELKHDQFAKAMHKVDPTIKLIAAEPCRTPWRAPSKPSASTARSFPTICRWPIGAATCWRTAWTTLTCSASTTTRRAISAWTSRPARRFQPDPSR